MTSDLIWAHVELNNTKLTTDQEVRDMLSLSYATFDRLSAKAGELGCDHCWRGTDDILGYWNLEVLAGNTFHQIWQHQFARFGFKKPRDAANFAEYVEENNYG